MNILMKKLNIMKKIIILLTILISCNSKTDKKEIINSYRKAELSEKSLIKEKGNNNQITKNEKAGSTRKKYINNYEIKKEYKYGISFTVPKSWKIKNKEYKSINLKGKITTIQTDYVDITDNSIISFIYHPNMKSKVNDISSDKSNYLLISNKKVLKKTEVLKLNGKGEKLKEPIKRVTLTLFPKQHMLNIILNSKSKISEETFNNFISNIQIDN